VAVMVVVIMVVVMIMMMVMPVLMRMPMFLRADPRAAAIMHPASAISTHYSISIDASSRSRPARKSVLTAWQSQSNGRRLGLQIRARGLDLYTTGM